MLAVSSSHPPWPTLKVCRVSYWLSWLDRGIFCDAGRYLGYSVEHLVLALKILAASVTIQAVLVTHFGHAGMMATRYPEAGISLWHRVSSAVEMRCRHGR